MNRSRRRTDPSKEIAHLEQRHQQLKEQVAEYEARLSLTPKEEVRLLRLKKEKLKTKDALHAIRH